MFNRCYAVSNQMPSQPRTPKPSLWELLGEETGISFTATGGKRTIHMSDDRSVQGLAGVEHRDLSGICRLWSLLSCVSKNRPSSRPPAMSCWSNSNSPPPSDESACVPSGFGERVGHGQRIISIRLSRPSGQCPRCKVDLHETDSLIFPQCYLQSGADDVAQY